MRRVNPLLGLDRASADDVGKRSRVALSDLRQQLNSGTQLVGVRNGKRPRGLKTNDMTVELSGTTIKLGASDANGKVTEIKLTEALGSSGGITNTTNPPALVDLPLNLNWGFHRDTSTGTFYIAINDGGTIRIPSLSGFTGSLSFTRLSGTITNAQHAALDSAVASHSVATGAVAGFEPAAHWTLLNSATASPTNSTIVIRGAGGTVDATSYRVSGTKVVDAQGAAVPHVAGSISATAYDIATRDTIIEMKAAINSTLARIEAHGLILP